MTVTLAPGPPLDRPDPAVKVQPAVRVKPAPPLEPPYDDERPADAWPVCPGQLEIVRTPAGGAQRRRPTRPRWPPNPGLPTVSAAHTTPPQPSSEGRIAAHRFVGTCVEMLNGFRPPSHLRALSLPVTYPDIIDQLTRRAVRIRMTPQHGRPTGRPSTTGVVIRRLRICEPRNGVAEAAAVLAHGDATWAMAIRLERHCGSWVCTLLQVI